VRIWLQNAQAEQHPVASAFVETLGTGEQQLADLLERVVFAAPLAEGQTRVALNEFRCHRRWP